MHGLPVLRDFVATDQPQVRDLVLDGLGGHWGHIEESLNPDLDDIGRFYASGRTVVAEIGDHVVGTGTLMPTSDSCAEIVRMAVAPAWRRHGVGRLIVEALIRTAQVWGSERVVLETSSQWIDAITFYLECGFEVTHQVDGDFGRDTWFERRL